jgi:hypothetical protein
MEDEESGHVEAVGTNETFDVLTAVCIKISVLWGATQYIL